MEASVATTQAPPEPEVTHDGQAEATRSTEELFQWSGYVHVGRGADGCEHGVDGACSDPEHYHIWVCLPNSFQTRDITEKARAAKARKTRSLRDPESDAHAVLEAELEEVRDSHYDELIDALARKRSEEYLPDIVRELSEDERFEHRAADAEEYQRLSGIPEGERDAEEFERLQADMLAYADEVQKAIDDRVKTEVTALRQMEPDAVLEEERKSRIENIANETYLFQWYTWAMYVCAREPTTDGFPSQRKFAKPELLHAAPPEVVTALREKIRQLETRTVARGDAAGN